MAAITVRRQAAAVEEEVEEEPQLREVEDVEEEQQVEEKQQKQQQESSAYHVDGLDTILEEGNLFHQVYINTRKYFEDRIKLLRQKMQYLETLQDILREDWKLQDIRDSDQLLGIYRNLIQFV